MNTIRLVIPFNIPPTVWAELQSHGFHILHFLWHAGKEILEDIRPERPDASWVPAIQETGSSLEIEPLAGLMELRKTNPQEAERGWAMLRERLEQLIPEQGSREVALKGGRAVVSIPGGWIALR